MKENVCVRQNRIYRISESFPVYCSPSYLQETSMAQEGDNELLLEKCGDPFDDNALNDKIQEDIFFDFTEEIDFRDALGAPEGAGDTGGSKRGSSTAAFVGAATGAFATTGISNDDSNFPSRIVRFADEIDPAGAAYLPYNLESQASLTDLDVFADLPTASKPTLDPNSESIEYEEMDDNQEVEEEEEDDTRRMMMAAVGGMAFSILGGHMLRWLFKVLFRGGNNDVDGGGVVTDSANEAADAGMQAKNATTFSAHSAGTTSKTSADAAMQASFNASANASQSSQNLVGAFVVNNPSSTLSGAQ